MKMKLFHRLTGPKHDHQNEKRKKDGIHREEQQCEGIEDELLEMLDDLTEVYKKGTKRAADYMVHFARNKIAPLIEKKLVLDSKSRFDPKTFEIFEVISEDATALSDRRSVKKTQVIPEYKVSKDTKNNTIHLDFSGEFSYRTINTKENDGYSEGNNLQTTSYDSQGDTTYTGTQGGTVYTDDDYDDYTNDTGTYASRSTANDNRAIRQDNTSFHTQNDDWTATMSTNGEESLCNTLETTESQGKAAKNERYASDRSIVRKLSSCSTDSFLSEVKTPCSETDTDSNIKMIRRKKMFSKMSSRRLQRIVEDNNEIDSAQLTNDKYFQAFQSYNGGNKWNVTLPIMLENDVELKIVSFDDFGDLDAESTIDKVKSETREDLNKVGVNYKSDIIQGDTEVNDKKPESLVPSQSNSAPESTKLGDSARVYASNTEDKVIVASSRVLESIAELSDDDSGSSMVSGKEHYKKTKKQPTGEDNETFSQREDEGSYYVTSCSEVDTASGLSKDVTAMSMLENENEISEAEMMKRTLGSMNQTPMMEEKSHINVSKIVMFQDECDLIIIHNNDHERLAPVEAVEIVLSIIEKKKDEEIEVSKEESVDFKEKKVKHDPVPESRDDITPSLSQFSFASIQINKPQFSGPAEERRYDEQIAKLARISLCESVVSSQNNLSKRCIHSGPHSLQMIKPSRKVVTKEEVRRANQKGMKNRHISDRMIMKSIGLRNNAEKLKKDELRTVTPRTIFNTHKRNKSDVTPCKPKISPPLPTSLTSELEVKSPSSIRKKKGAGFQKTSTLRHGKLRPRK